MSAGWPMVAAGQGDSPEHQLARHPDRHRLQPAVDDVGRRVGDRPSDRQRALRRLAVKDGDLARLRRAVLVVELGLDATQEAIAELRAERLAAAVDPAQAGAAALQVRLLEEGLQHRGDEVDGRDRLLLHQAGDVGGIGVAAWLGQDHGGADHQRPEELPDRDVEAEGRLLHQSVGGRQAVLILHPEQTVGQAGVVDHHALGLAGRAGRVDHVGEVARGPPRPPEASPGAHRWGPRR